MKNAPTNDQAIIESAIIVGLGQSNPIQKIKAK
jgi:hypothetical protein